MNKAKLLTVSAEDIAVACKTTLYKVHRDRKNKVFDFGDIKSVSTYIGMMRARQELADEVMK